VILTPCNCNRSLAILGGLFATLAACAFIAEDACLDGGGRVSDAAWACEFASEATVSLWSLLSPAGMAFAALVVGVPVALVVNAVGKRFIVACGLPAN
jgi:hypothetical protein